MNHSLKNLALLFAVITLTCLHAVGQSCYTPITSFQGDYTLSANGSGTCPPGTCTVNQSVSADVVANRGSASCGSAMWGGQDTPTSISVNDIWTFPCSSGGTATETFTPLGGFHDSGMLLTIDPSNGTYTPQPLDDANVLVTLSGCGSHSQSEAMPVFPTSNWPQKFPLPATVQTLSEAKTFQARWWVLSSTTFPWTFTFTLTPNYTHDDDCRKSGGSSIGCENQSLGEDVAVAGTGFDLHYESDRAPGAAPDPIASRVAAMMGGWTISIHDAYNPNTNTLFFGDGRQRNGYQLGTPVSFNGNLLVTSEDGSEVYVFTTMGQHLQTLRPLTGAVEYTFGYDSAHFLTTITDGSGNVTTIQRNTSEQPMAIVSPFGQTTTLAVDSNGFLSQVTDPLGKTQSFANDSGGLLISRTDQNGNIFNYSYDSNGRLTEDADQLGGFTDLSRTAASTGLGWTVTETTAMGRTSSYQSTDTLPWGQDGTKPQSEQRTITGPDGLPGSSSHSLNNGQLSHNYTLPDGTSDSRTVGADPVWGIQVPVDTSETFTLGNLSMSITGSRTTTLGTAGNPFTVTAQTDTRTVNGRSYTNTFTGSTRTWVRTSPVGRTLTVGLDSLERVASAQIAGQTATSFAYDGRGRLASATEGTRKTTYSYDTAGFLASVTDAMKLTTSYTHDADGNLLTMTFPDGRVVSYTHDANGNLTSVTPPGRPAHDVAYNAVNLIVSYSPPSVPGTGATTYSYNLDRELTSITRPDGKKITYGYDTADRLISEGTPTGTTKYTYNTTTGNLASATRGLEHLSYGYNGPLPTKSTWTGTVAGTVSRAFNNNFWVSSQSVAGGSSVPFAYDNDGLLIKAGSLAVKRSAKNGLITGTTLSAATDARTYNSFGELIGYTASISGTPVYAVKYTRDADGRVTAKTETVNGTTNNYSYGYDLSGRLATATKNAATNTYTYDSNSNRLSITNSSGTTTGTYDAQDRLLTYGSTSYTYTANGELTSQTTAGKTTTYTYDVLGNLIAVTLPSGTKIAYVIDAADRRVGKQVNGVLQSGFLYDHSRIVAQLNGSNQVVSQFIYGTSRTSPDCMISGGNTYRIFSDQLGSPLLVANTTTGAIVEEIIYDEFGNVISDTNPGFQPFGFAGGLYDQDTQLLRFGARDYSAALGRWTAKDPILFAGGDVNLYGYVLDDPVNLTDMTGLCEPTPVPPDWILKASKGSKELFELWLRQRGYQLIESVEALGKGVVNSGRWWVSEFGKISGNLEAGIIVLTPELKRIFEGKPDPCERDPFRTSCLG